MTTLKTVDPRTDPLWLELIENTDSSVFHSPAWITAVMKTYDWDAQAHILLDEQGKPVAGMPFSIIEDLRGRRGACFPFSDFCDPIVETEDQWRQLMEPILEMNIPFSVRPLHNDVPVRADSDHVVNKAGWHGADLSAPIDDIWMRIHGSARRAVRKAEKSDVTIRLERTPEAMRTYFDMHLAIRKYKYRLLAQPYALFENILTEVIQKQGGFVLIAEREGEPIGANVYLEWKNTLIYKFSASIYEGMKYRPTDALIWHAFTYAKENNLIYFDFGLSDLDQDGLLDFKRKYATDEKEIQFMKYIPDGYEATGPQKQAGALFPKLTEAFTNPDVPDDVTERGGELLYKFFA